MAGSVVVRVSELQELDAELTSIRERLDDVGRLRLDAARLQSRVRRILGTQTDPEKTPLRPPSSDAMKAFQSSSSFLAVKPPKK